jgi:uncharacterized protein YegL
MTKVTDLVYIADVSGSMSSLIRDVEGSINGFVEEQKKEPGEAYFTLITFSTTNKVIYDRKPLHEVPFMTPGTLSANGGTALRDAMGFAISKFPEHFSAIFMCFTDGEENSSKEYTQGKIKALISARQAAGQRVEFVGVGIDAFAQGSVQLGLSSQFTHNVDASVKGITQDMRGVYSASASAYRAA